MNKAYNYKSNANNKNVYESNCRIIKIEKSEEQFSALDTVGAFIERISSQNAMAIIKAIIATLCFFGFIGVIGGVENETISIGSGIIISLFLVFVEIICFTSTTKRKNH